MACRCLECGKPAECGEKLCWTCWLAKQDDERVEANIMAGGRFYGVKRLLNNENLIKQKGYREE